MPRPKPKLDPPSDLNCEDGEHSYRKTGEHEGGTCLYVCRDCGRKILD